MSESAAAPAVPKRPRRWLRFGLRTFLVVVALAGATLGLKVRQVRLQRAAVEWVRENDGRVFYDFEWDDESQNLVLDSLPPRPAWLRSLGGIDYVARPTVVYLGSVQVTDLTPLADLTELQGLCLFGTHVDDLTPLADLEALQWLVVAETQVNDVAPLSKLVGLQELVLAGSQVNDLTPLASLAELPILDLSRTQIADVTPLEKLTDLQELNLAGAPVRDESVAELQRALPSLTIIR